MTRKQLLKLFFGALALLLSPTSAYARAHWQGQVELGGRPAIVGGTQSTLKYQQSYPGALITVCPAGTSATCLAGTTPKATLYSNSTGTPKANPFNANTDGSASFYAVDGKYDITFSAGGIATPFTQFDVLLVDSLGSTISTIVNAANYATGGAGTLVSPYTSDTGTGGIQEAYAALAAASPTYGAVYAPASYYSITRTNGTNFAINSTVQVGNLVGTGGITFYGDGAISTILLGSTAGPVIDTTGQGHLTLRDFGIRSGASNRSTTGILQGRSTLGYSVFPQHNTIERVYINLTHDDTANTNRGVVGIYNTGGESNEYVNNEVYTDNPLVISSDNTFAISSGNVANNTAIRFASNNHVRGGMYRTSSSLSTAAAVILQGSVEGTTLEAPVLQKDTGATAQPLYAIRGLDHVTSAAHTAGDQVANVHFDAIQVENFSRVLLLTAQWWSPHITGACAQDVGGSSTFILLGAANAKIKNGYINIAAAQEVSTGQIINDGGTATGGVYNTTIFLPASMNIIMSASPGVANRVYSDGNPSTVYSTTPQDPSAVVQTTAAVQISGLAGRVVTVTLVNGANENIDTQGASIIRIVGPTGAFSIGGFTNTGNGRWLEVFNTVMQTMTIKINSAGTTSGQKINTLQSADVVLRAANQSYASFMYDSTLSFWMLKSYN